MEIDIVRKKELLMEKKLRACRVNILPRTGGYFPASPPPVQSPPVTPPPLTPSPEAVEKATNPIALRYWAQCLDKNTEPSRVLSTAGTGVSRDNEVVEARNNINRFITVDKVRKKETGGLVRSQSQSRLESPPVRPYSQVKEDQIKISQDRANFHNRALNLVAKSPQPFRRGLSETRSVTREVRLERPEREQRVVRQPSSTDSLLALNDNQKAKLIQVLLDQLPPHVGDNLVAERLSSLNPSRLYSITDHIESEAVNTIVPLIFPRAKDDVKLSLVLESVPKLTRLLRQN